MTTVETTCECCGFPCFAKEKQSPVICHQCEMIATGATYRDGSSPADKLSPASLEAIVERYAELLGLPV